MIKTNSDHETKPPTVYDPRDVRLLVCITHMFKAERLRYLSDALASLYSLDVVQIDITIFTETSNPDDLQILERIFTKFRSSFMTISISSHPDVKAMPKTLPWKHKDFMRRKHTDASSCYTHYLYLEDDILFSHGNLMYFLRFRSDLKIFNLIPGLVRYEYNHYENDLFTTDQQGKQNFSEKTRVICRGISFINLNEPYAAMFILDRELMDEYIVSRSFSFDLSLGVVPWGDLERAAMGLTWEDVPPGFQSRCAIPLQAGTTTPDVMCWIKHIPSNYTNDYRDTPNLAIGKTRIDQMFMQFERRDCKAPYISCFSAEDVSDHSISFVEEIYPHTTYDRPIPDTESSEPFNEQLNRICSDVNRVHKSICKTIVVSFATAYLFGPVLYVESDNDLCLLFETFRPVDRHAVTALNPDIIINTFVDYDVPKGNCTIFIGSAGSFNYGHWLVDDLPRLKAVWLLRSMFPDLEIRVLFSQLGSTIDAVRRESTETYLSTLTNYTIDFLDCKTPYKVKSLFYASPVSLHPTSKSPAAVAWVSSQLASLKPDAALRPGQKQRIFVTRRPPDSRALLNHQEVADFLSEHEFVMIDVNGLDFSQQTEIFRNADVIVGCMGAAMTNSILCKLSVTIVMLAPEGWIEPFYWDLAAVRGDKYVACYGEPDDKSVAANASSYTIDVGKLSKLMSRLGLLRSDRRSTLATLMPPNFRVHNL